jgi:dienelactone hydrolase
MRDRARRLAVWLAMAVISSPAVARASQSLAQRADMLAANTQYYAPPGGGRRPLVILSSGCGGVVGPDGPNRVMNDYAEAAVRGGAYAIIVDGLQARGIGRKAAIRTVCTGLRLRGAERAGDIVAGEELARRHWGSQFTGMILGGWSHGGWAVMELLSDGPEARKIGSLRLKAPQASLRPDAVVLYYPYCGFLNSAGRGPDWVFKGPLLLVTAELDTIGPAKKCLPIISDAMAGDLSGVRNLDFPGMTHAFDEETQSPNSKFVYNREAATRSELLFSDFVRQQVARLR